ncbi:MAG: hypothetical protein ACTSUI_00585 [Promethearchaeota archaeon]
MPRPHSQKAPIAPVAPVAPIAPAPTAPMVPRNSIPMAPMAPVAQNISMEEWIYPPASEEPITFPEDITITELIEIRRIIDKNDKRYWAAFDLIQLKRDEMMNAHYLATLKAMQDLTIALYKTNKMKIPAGVGKSFEEMKK